MAVISGKNKTRGRGWRDGSVVRAPDALPEDQGSLPSEPGGSQAPITPIPGPPTPSSGLRGQFSHTLTNRYTLIRIQ